MAYEHINTVTIDGEIYEAILVFVDLNGHSIQELYVDYGNVLSRVELTDHHTTTEKFGESRFDLINRFMTDKRFVVG